MFKLAEFCKVYNLICTMQYCADTDMMTYYFRFDDTGITFDCIIPFDTIHSIKYENIFVDDLYDGIIERIGLDKTLWENAIKERGWRN